MAVKGDEALSFPRGCMHSSNARMWRKMTRAGLKEAA